MPIKKLEVTDDDTLIRVTRLAAIAINQANADAEFGRMMEQQNMAIDAIRNIGEENREIIIDMVPAEEALTQTITNLRNGRFT